MAGGFVHGRVDGAQDDGQGLVDEDEHDADLRQVGGVRHVLTPAQRQRRLSGYSNLKAAAKAAKHVAFHSVL